VLSVNIEGKERELTDNKREVPRSSTSSPTALSPYLFAYCVACLTSLLRNFFTSFAVESSIPTFTPSHSGRFALAGCLLIWMYPCFAISVPLPFPLDFLLALAFSSTPEWQPSSGFCLRLRFALHFCSTSAFGIMRNTKDSFAPTRSSFLRALRKTKSFM
jgi:hypothetical protein